MSDLTVKRNAITQYQAKAENVLIDTFDKIINAINTAQSQIMGDDSATDSEKATALNSIENIIPTMTAYFTIRGILLSVRPDCIPPARTTEKRYFTLDSDTAPTALILGGPDQE